MTSNRVTGTHFRNEVILEMQARGLAACPPAGTWATSAPVKGNNNSIAGLPWALLTRRDGGPIDFSGGVNDAARLAEETGRSLHAAIYHRRGYPIEGAYAVTSLAVLIEVTKLLDPQLASIARGPV